jgi:hypothetical protein
MRRLILLLAVGTFGNGCQNSSPTPMPGDWMKHGRIEVVVQCLHRRVAEYYRLDISSVILDERWSPRRTSVVATMQERNSNRALAQYRIDQLPDSIRMEGSVKDWPTDVLQSSAEAKAFMDRQNAVTGPCLDEGGFYNHDD